MGFWLAIMTIGAIVLLIALQYGSYFFRPRAMRLRVLMYHSVSVGEADFLTIPAIGLERQFVHLERRGYQPISCQQLIDWQDGKGTLPKRPVILTFDDGYLSNATLLYPLLKKHHLIATIFIPTKFIGQTNAWDNGTEAIMDVQTLQSLDPNVVELGLHSHAHLNYKHADLVTIAEDLQTCIATMNATGLRCVPALAYPYGGVPKDRAALAELEKLLQANGIRLGLRIGNQVNVLPLANPYLIKRIDIRGDEPFWKFRVKLRLGRVKPF